MAYHIRSWISARYDDGNGSAQGGGVAIQNEVVSGRYSPSPGRTTNTLTSERRGKSNSNDEVFESGIEIDGCYFEAACAGISLYFDLPREQPTIQNTVFHSELGFFGHGLPRLVVIRT